MGMNFIFGNGAKPVGGSNTVNFNNYRYQKAKDIKIKGGGVGFLNKVTNSRFGQRLSGKTQFKVKEGYLTSKDARQYIYKLAKKYGSNGLSGHKIKEEFKKMGMDYKDAEAVALAATHPWAEPEHTGLTEKQKQRNIMYRRYQDMEQQEKEGVLGVAAGLSRKRGSKEGALKGLTKKEVTSEAIGVAGRKLGKDYGISASAEAEKVEKTSASAVNSSSKNVAASVVAGIGTIEKEQEAKKEKVINLEEYRKKLEKNLPDKGFEYEKKAEDG